MWQCPNCRRPVPARFPLLNSAHGSATHHCEYCNALLGLGTRKGGLLLTCVLCTAACMSLAATLPVKILPVAFGVAAFLIIAGVHVCCVAILLVETDHTVCPSCRFDLHGNTSGVCPECGTPFVRSHGVDR
jgi:hypothetical protein